MVAKAVDTRVPGHDTRLYLNYKAQACEFQDVPKSHTLRLLILKKLITQTKKKNYYLGLQMTAKTAYFVL